MAGFRSFRHQRFFRNSEGQITIWQWPNVPLWGWIIFKVLGLIDTTPALRSGFGKISTAFIFTWAFLEIADGDNYFRRLLGAVVMLLIIIGFFSS